MNLQALLTDDDAVSPVIGVILMVAITVILAAVIGTFVLGIGGGTTTTPQASFDFQWNSSSDNLTITHTGGDTFTNENSDELRIVDSGGNVDQTWPLPVSAGTQKTVDDSGLPGETVRVIWTSPGGDESQSVGSFDVPT